MATRFMDTDKVEGIANGLETISGVLKVVNSIMEGQMGLLKSTAFMGAVGGLAVERYLSLIQPEVERMMNKTKEMSDDARKSVAVYKAAAQQG